VTVILLQKRQFIANIRNINVSMANYADIFNMRSLQ
jgi:hypothetical protein